MIIEKIPVCGALETNAYFCVDEQNKNGFLIDPGAEADKLIKVVQQKEWNIEKILLTHGHFDHIGAVQQISKTLNIPYFIHKSGEEMLKNPELNLSAYFGNELVLNDAEYFGDEFTFKLSSETELKVIHTPGHTPCSVIFYCKAENIIFSGDTLFKQGIGATHFPGGNYETLLTSLQNKVFSLPSQTKVYPGHGENTIIAKENYCHM